MADAVPGWTDRPAEWAVLRDQIAATSKPTLSDSIRLSFYILMVLCSSSIGFHLLAVCLRLRRNTCLRNRFFGCTSLGHHQPDLTLILPILLVINALLNLASLCSLLSDANRLQFKGYTMAIQQFNFSLLLSAGILLTWALVCGLPPLYVGMCGAPRNRFGQEMIPWIHSRKAIKPSRLHWLGYSSLVLVFLVPFPCIILTMKSIGDINNLDGQLLVTVNHVLESAIPPAGDLIANALQTINKLDQTSGSLFTHLRMLSAIHLFLTFAILAVYIWISIKIIRKLIKQAPLKSSSTYPMQEHPTDASNDQTSDSYKAHQQTPHVSEPKPALLAHSHETSADQPSIEHINHSQDYKAEGLGDKTTNQIDRSSLYNTNPTDTFASETYLEPSADNRHHQDPQSEAEQVKSISNYVKKLKFILILSVTCASAFMILNLCILANSFKYPDEISIGDLMILKLEWSTWLWNGSISPLIGLTNCVILMNKTRKSSLGDSTAIKKHIHQSEDITK
ncbi:hypothetical protein PCANC_00115 [Puccinia coronata f. sp. avenae]|uniref:Uncharacterized protein n=1 Tax=Puccinia coronata f. sp. avenae TaxID=200324 RepID=A0A2N5W8V7_9BASI|nr:hypothetical protein PCANC_00115 [Puccinia coronata f. sp. avenae]